MTIIAVQDIMSPAQLVLGALVLVVVGTWVFRAIRTAYLSPLSKIPGPWYAPLTHLRLKAAVLSGRRLHYIHSMHRSYGPVVRIAPTEISVSDLAAVKRIHAINSGFTKSLWYEELTQFPRLGLFAEHDVKLHAARRRLFARPFSKSYLRQQWEGLVREKAALAVGRILSEVERQGVADVLKWWTFLATDVAATLMFGEGFGMLEKGEKTEYIRVLESTMMGSGIGVELPWVRTILRRVPIPALQELFNANHKLLSYGTQAVTNARSSKSNVFTGPIAEADRGLDIFTDEDVRIEAAALIVAGSDTTGITLTYLTWAVLQRPDLRRQLEEEVARLPPDFDDAQLEALPLLNATIDETLRLYGAAPGTLPRMPPKGGVEIAGYSVPDGTTVGTQSYTLHRDPEVFQDPESFDPFRWLRPADSPEQAEMIKTAFSPFGAGSRTCIGLHLARMELRITAAIFLRQCKGRLGLATSTTPESMEFENYFLIAPKAHKCEVVFV